MAARRRIAYMTGDMSDPSALGHIRPWRHIERRKSRQIMVGNVPVGGGAPITVQSMTNTPTSDAAATIDQIRRLEGRGRHRPRLMPR